MDHRRMNHRRDRRGFTIIELLTVVGIIVTLVGTTAETAEDSRSLNC